MTAASLGAVFAVLSAAPALGQTERKTELVGPDGASVDSLPLRHDVDASWVIDTQSILYRDTSRDYYLVTLKAACKQLATQRPFDFHPAVEWQLREDRSYEVRPLAGPRCGVTKIEQVDDARAAALQLASLRRVW
jgi:hypothetical protein